LPTSFLLPLGSAFSIARELTGVRDEREGCDVVLTPEAARSDWARAERMVEMGGKEWGGVVF
jgi:hypothetical protein